MSSGGSWLQKGLLGVSLLASAWAVLTPLLVFLSIFEIEGAMEPIARVNAPDAGRLGETLAALLPAAALGFLGGAGGMLVWRGSGHGRAMMGVSGAALLVLSVFTASSVGWFLFAPAVLFFFPAVLLEKPRG